MSRAVLKDDESVIDRMRAAARRHRTLMVTWRALPFLLLTGCGTLDPEALPHPLDLRINEVVSDNEGVHLDEYGETEDYVELYNASSRTLSLSDYVIENRRPHELPPLELLPGQVVLLWADDAPEQGPLHLPFKLDAGGEPLALFRKTGEEVDRVLIPPLAEHHAFARQPDGTGGFVDCGWATPERRNGERCGPPPPAPPPDDLAFAPYDWPEVWPELASPLAIVEAALRPASFVELVNSSDAELSLADFSLAVATHRYGTAWPEAGRELSLPNGSVGAGERVVVQVDEAELAELSQSPALPAFEGVLTLRRRSDRTVVDRVDFSSWPDGAVLARPEPAGPFRFCTNATPGAANDPCQELASRSVGDHERRILTPADFHALAAGRQALGTESVEFVVDMANDDAVTFLNAGAWDLHYTFVREVIDRAPRLDRCDPVQREEFMRGWIAFSQEHYYQVEGRRYLLGNIVKHAGSGLATVEFTPGDTISAAQMRRAFFKVVEHLPDPTSWAIRPQANDQVERVRSVEGGVPIVGPNAPFRGVTFQPLAPGVAFGTLRFVPASELELTALGPRDVVVTDEVPNDIPLIGGLVTEAFQTPLAHVNILSRGRGTPNMALRDARTDPRLVPYFGRLVKLEVEGAAFNVTDALPEEAIAFWESRRPAQVLTPRLDLGPRGVQPLSERGLADIPSIGGKAAQLAELGRVTLCSNNPAETPDRPFAIPLVHSVEHYAASGAAALLAELRNDANFVADPVARERGLSAVRARILRRPVDRALLAEVKAAIRARWPDSPLRFRSSSNTEDLPGFSGAGLYTSEGLDTEDVADGVEDAIRTVWASLFERRGYDEREYAGVDQAAVAMAVLVHPAYRSERVNGVAVSRDALQPTRGDRYYVNAQIGEALVTNPAPGVESEQFTYQLERLPRILYHSRSSFSPDAPVLEEAEANVLACNLFQIHQHFRPLLDPHATNAWFAMDIEWKLMGEEHSLVIKQARAYSFGEETPSGWCDF